MNERKPYYITTPIYYVNGAPHILNVSIPNIRAQVLVQACEQYGLLMGMGSACSASKGGQSRLGAFCALLAVRASG